MQTLTKQLETLAMQPHWEQSDQSALAFLSTLSEEEQALLKEKIICYVLTPEPETPEPDNTPEPEQPEEPEESEALPAAKLTTAA